MSKTALALCACLAALLPVGGASAQDAWPARPVVIIVPCSAACWPTR